MHFHKYHGAGNDFLLFDGRGNLPFDLSRHDFIFDLCYRRFGVGADGVMVLTEATGYDFEMQYFNADGYPGSMCGNGGRCIVAFAKLLGIKPTRPDNCYQFLAVDGPHQAKILANGQVELEMQEVDDIKTIATDCVLDTGSPHYIRWVDEVADVDVYKVGKSIRNSAPYVAAGINVNFVQEIKENTLLIRTYERGVEDETYACGTGVTAAAIALVKNRSTGSYNIMVQAKGGSLGVRLDWDTKKATNIWLTGPATHVFSGKI